MYGCGSCFFETFEHPEANISTFIDPDLLSDLAQIKRKTIDLPFSMNLHGVTKELQAKLSLTLIGNDLVAVSTAEPINISVADFNLAGGLKKLEEAAGVVIVPSSTISFDFIFRKASDGQAVTTAAVSEPVQQPSSAALEADGDFSLDACIGRFEILSRTGNIYFRPGSAQLDDASAPLLNAVVDIVSRCPDLSIQVAGHTDGIGSRAANQRLSERRAASVVGYLSTQGIPSARMKSVGFGEDKPVADNSTNEGRTRNRRIEFSVPKS